MRSVTSSGERTRSPSTATITSAAERRPCAGVPGPTIEIRAPTGVAVTVRPSERRATAAAMRCLNGEILARLVARTREDEERAAAMGVRDLRRIYMPPDYQSFPLRKDFLLADDAARSPGGGVRPMERGHTPVTPPSTAVVRRTAG